MVPNGAMSKLDDLKRLGAARLERISSKAVRSQAEGGANPQTKSPPKAKIAEVAKLKNDDARNDDVMDTMSGSIPAGRGPEIVNEVIGALNSRRGGRPLAKDAHTAAAQVRPWLAAGMSRRTYYRRRQKEAKK